MTKHAKHDVEPEETEVRKTATDRVLTKLGRKKTAKEAVAEKKEAEAQRESPTPAPPSAPVFRGPPPAEPLPPGSVEYTPEPDFADPRDLPATAKLPPPPILSRTVTPPAVWTKEGGLVFLDGGMGKAENWQTQVFESLRRLGLQVLNPKRWDDARLKLKAEIQEQIRWEQKAGEEAEFFVFWFTANWVYPLAMYRLGQALARRKRVFVGAHPDSPMLADLEAQLENYGAKVYQNLNTLCGDLLEALKAKKD